MWPPWNRNTHWELFHSSASPFVATSASYPSFAFSSFKDIHSLFFDDTAINATTSLSPKKPSIFHCICMATSTLHMWHSLPPVREKCIMVYFTSLCVVHKTFEDYHVVRFILLGFRVAVNERDLSIDSWVLNEFKGILGKRQLSLPRVFIRGRYMDGVDEILKDA